MPRITFLLSLALLLLLQSNPAGAQIQIGAVRGAVSDPAGALLPGAELTLDNSVNGFHASTKTAELGEYKFDNVPFGSYVLRASVGGFQSVARTVSVRSNISRRRQRQACRRGTERVDQRGRRRATSATGFLKQRNYG